MCKRIAVCIPIIVLACQPPPAVEVPPVTREAINSQLPARPYSEAVRVGDTYFFSGKVGVSDETLAMESGRIEAETRNVMEAFGALFQELGVEFGHVVQGTVFLADIEDYAGMNQVYGEYFPADPPARETVAVKDIVGQGKVEISFVAVAPSGSME
ncbi:RidA family protein [Gemmatimonadota bacterium]